VLRRDADFSLDEAAIAAQLARAGEIARGGGDVLVRAAAGDPIDAAEGAALWLGREWSTGELFAAASEVKARRADPLETFAPLYLTNTCDAECKMCGMRRDNGALRRETADEGAIAAQLATLANRGMYGVALLTGEYRGEARSWAVARVRHALGIALDLGFRHVLVNMGALEEAELADLLRDVPRRADGAVAPKVTMCTFQETYSRARYARFMGASEDNPRAGYERRLANFDRSRRSGFRVANPGILVGLNADLAYEIVALALHVRHLAAAGMEVYVSVPRLRATAGGQGPAGIDDDAFTRLVAVLAIALPEAKLVLTTREPREMQRRLAPLVTVLSAGSAAVAPYSAASATFPLASSQFEVIDQRPFEEILSEHLPPGGTIVNFRPVERRASGSS
jgi:3-methyl-2-indolic acid synthase